MAHLPGGITSIGLPRDTIRQIWGAGVRAGLYPVSGSEVYWFTCFNADEVRARAGGSTICCNAILLVGGQYRLFLMFALDAMPACWHGLLTRGLL